MLLIIVDFVKLGVLFGQFDWSIRMSISGEYISAVSNFFWTVIAVFVDIYSLNLVFESKCIEI